LVANPDILLPLPQVADLDADFQVWIWENEDEMVL
jgi:hypothetical protein